MDPRFITIDYFGLEFCPCYDMTYSFLLVKLIDFYSNKIRHDAMEIFFITLYSAHSQWNQFYNFINGMCLRWPFNVHVMM